MYDAISGATKGGYGQPISFQTSTTEKLKAPLPIFSWSLLDEALRTGIKLNAVSLPPPTGKSTTGANSIEIPNDYPTYGGAVTDIQQSDTWLENSSVP